MRRALLWALPLGMVQPDDGSAQQQATDLDLDPYRDLAPLVTSRRPPAAAHRLAIVHLLLDRKAPVDGNAAVGNPARVATIRAPILAVVTILPLVLVSAPATAGAQVCGAAASREDPALGRFFEDYNANGTFVLFEPGSGTCVLHDPARARLRFLPASTFKIFNTMVALDAGSIADATTVLKWDGVDRGSAGWNRDQDMRTALRSSTVWFYQELARRTGEMRMREFLERETYGNAAVTGGIDSFWLTGGLAISADEQVAFLHRLYRGQLAFSMRAQHIARELLVLEQTDTYTLRGKTGWTQSGGRQLGWLVGWVEKDAVVHFFALNLDSPDPDFPMRDARMTILRRALDHLGVLPAAARDAAGVAMK